MFAFRSWSLLLSGSLQLSIELVNSFALIRRTELIVCLAQWNFICKRIFSFNTHTHTQTHRDAYQKNNIFLPTFGVHKIAQNEHSVQIESGTFWRQKNNQAMSNAKHAINDFSNFVRIMKISKISHQKPELRSRQTHIYYAIGYIL